MNAFLRLIREVHRRSLWQVLGIYLVAGWAAFEVVQTLTEGLGLPEWFPAFALGLLIVGLPVVLATAFIQEGGPGGGEQASTPDAGPGPSSGVHSRVFTWRNAIGGGVLAFALWGVVAAAWLAFGGAMMQPGDAASVALSAVDEVEAARDRGDAIAAYRLAAALPLAVPDSTRRALFSSVSVPGTQTSTPQGATVSWRPYGDLEGDWEILGTTPLEWDFPRSPVALRLELQSYASRTVVPNVLGGNPSLRDVRLRSLEEPFSGALHVPGGEIGLRLADARIAHAPPVVVGDYLFDRYEVTNRQFEEFVAAGGYEQARYWEHPFVRDGERLSREDAVAAFVDRTGRPGPSTWVGGTYPEGTGDHPVTGVSWYEAEAFARFAGRELPTLYHWHNVALPFSAQWVVPFSNMGGEGTAPVGSYAGVTPPGAYDMAGNAREWLRNPAGDLRHTAGGGWNDPPYLFALTQPQPPFDRSEANGFRLMSNLGSREALERASRPVERVTRDFYAEEPVSDEVFEAFLELYRYDDLPLAARVEAVDTVETGIRETITLGAAYGGERLILRLYRTRQLTGSLQTVVYVPGSGAFNLTDSGAFGDGSPIISFLVRSGRAVVVPVLKGTFERHDDFVYRLQDPSNAYRDHVIQWRQDIGRALDYLETRPDVDAERFAYFGASFGGRMGGILLAVERRFRAAALLVAGLSHLPTQPVVDPLNFLPRVRLPVLVMSGEYDQIYPLDSSARPFFDLLGTGDALKRHYVGRGGHLIPDVDLTGETLDWFDRHLGETR